MLETLIHVREELNPDRRAVLCRSLAEHGVECDVRPSARAHLMFVRFDGRITPAQLCEDLERRGWRIRLVDV